MLIAEVVLPTADLTADALGKACATYAYHRQAAHYLAALAAEGVVDAEFWFCFVSKEAPHEVAIVRLDGDALAKGAAEMALAKDVYAKCVASGKWPTAQQAGWVPDTISLPRWYKGDADE